VRTAGALVGALSSYARIAWWGLVRPRTERTPLTVVQAVVAGPRGVLLSVRSDLLGWELPGGRPEPGEAHEGALLRELREETGLDVLVEWHVGDWIRTGFRPHTARVYRCRVVGGEIQPSEETLRVAWHALDALPDTLFPWYREPLAQGLSAEGAEPVTVRERWGVAEIAAGFRIDMKMRLDER
jgi:8-oxo-dGTP diphosphatase